MIIKTYGLTSEQNLRILMRKPLFLLVLQEFLYDIQLDIWKEQTQTDPVMLATQGASPIPIFRDIVENTDLMVRF